MTLAKKTRQTVILPITDPMKANRTVAILHKYFNFDKLTDEFFRIPQKVEYRMGYNQDPFVL